MEYEELKKAYLSQSEPSYKLLFDNPYTIIIEVGKTSQRKVYKDLNINASTFSTLYKAIIDLKS